MSGGRSPRRSSSHLMQIQSEANPTQEEESLGADRASFSTFFFSIEFDASRQKNLSMLFPSSEREGFVRLLLLLRFWLLMLLLLLLRRLSFSSPQAFTSVAQAFPLLIFCMSYSIPFNTLKRNRRKEKSLHSFSIDFVCGVSNSFYSEMKGGNFLCMN